jgi:recombinational DNA repair protein (RecF pathway)
MTCAHCGDTFVGPVHIEQGRIVCWQCFAAVRSLPESDPARAAYLAKVLESPRVIDDAQLLD